MGRSPTAREASLPASSVKDQIAALFLEGAAVAGRKDASELAEGPQAQLRPGTDDDVVVQRQAEIPAPLVDILGHAEIGLRGRRISRWVVVDLLCPVFLCARPSRLLALSWASGSKGGT